MESRTQPRQDNQNIEEVNPINVSKVSYSDRKESFELSGLMNTSANNFSSGLNYKKESLVSTEGIPQEFRTSPQREPQREKSSKKKSKKEKKERSRSGSQSFAVSPTRGKDKANMGKLKAAAFVLPNKGIMSGSFIEGEQQPRKVSILKPGELNSSQLQIPQEGRESSRKESGRRESSRQKKGEREKRDKDKKSVRFK